MNLLPKAAGSRPRLACEIAPGAVVGGCSPAPGLPLTAVARAELPEGSVVPSLRPGNVVDRVAAIAALRRVLEQIGGRPNARTADLTLVIPDAAVRVLLLDFDALPNKLSDALPLVRFRLKKLVPFETEDAMVTFQVMSTSRTVVRVLAVAIPRDVLSEYESLAREAGFEPGAVLPSTLAALAALDEGDGASLLVNAQPASVTTAIVRAGIVQLHRTVELVETATPRSVNLPAAVFEPTSATGASEGSLLPLVNREATQGEWAAQEALPEHGRNPYADRISAEEAVEDEDGLVGYSTPGEGDLYLRRAQAYHSALQADGEIAPVQQSPYLAPTVQAELGSDRHNAILEAPTTPGTLTDPAVYSDTRNGRAPAFEEEPDPPVHTLAPDALAEEIAQAVSVAVAYFEDSLGAVPPVVLSAGPLGAQGLERTLREQGLVQQDGLRVRELVDAAALSTSGATATVSRSWLAGVVGALRS